MWCSKTPLNLLGWIIIGLPNNRDLYLRTKEKVATPLFPLILEVLMRDIIFDKLFEFENSISCVSWPSAKDTIFRRWSSAIY
jgi:hypothetical protein